MKTKSTRHVTLFATLFMGIGLLFLNTVHARLGLNGAELANSADLDCLNRREIADFGSHLVQDTSENV